MNNQLKYFCLCCQLLSTQKLKIPLIAGEKLIPLTHCSLLVQHNFTRGCHLFVVFCFFC